MPKKFSQMTKDSSRFQSVANFIKEEDDFQGGEPFYDEDSDEQPPPKK